MCRRPIQWTVSYRPCRPPTDRPHFDRKWQVVTSAKFPLSFCRRSHGQGTIHSELCICQQSDPVLAIRKSCSTNIEFLSGFPREFYPPSLVEKYERVADKFIYRDLMDAHTLRPFIDNSSFDCFTIGSGKAGDGEQNVRKSTAPRLVERGLQFNQSEIAILHFHHKTDCTVRCMAHYISRHTSSHVRFIHTLTLDSRKQGKSLTKHPQ